MKRNLQLIALVPGIIVSGLFACRMLYEIWLHLGELTGQRLTVYAIFLFLGMLVWLITTNIFIDLKIKDDV